MDNNDRVNSSPSAYEILVQENLKLTKELDVEKEKMMKMDKQHKQELDKVNKNHNLVLKELHQKIERLEAQKQKTAKEKPVTPNLTESDESDIFEGLSESKKERIMAEVAELYEANLALQIENNALKKKQEKLTKGIKILDSKEGINQDSMNLDSDMFEGDEESYFKYGSYTDINELGKSHYEDSIGSIHNIFIDPTSESYIEGKKRELKAKIKPKVIPTLDFDQLNLPHIQPSLKIKGKNKKAVKASCSGKLPHYSLTNRSADERISFGSDKQNEDSEKEGQEVPTLSLEVEEAKNPHFHKTQDQSKNHIMIKEVLDGSFNL